jgi:signal peptide peptidase SppA
MSGVLSRLLPHYFRSDIPIVNVVRLHGAIGIGTPLKPALTLPSIADTLDRAFSRKGIAAVALAINSPGGSAVQSSLIHDRVRALADENKVPVYSFCEDVAASGGYWLACAGDEIYADASSIIGSIGVLAAGFGFVDAMKKIGIERRVHTAGENKVILDPFQPEKPEDVERLRRIQVDIHDAFKTLVRYRRAGKLKADEDDLFSGAFWAGREALELGLVDGIGHLRDVMKNKLGPKTELRLISKPSRWGLRRLAFGAETDLGTNIMDAAESRALWARFGL